MYIKVGEKGGGGRSANVKNAKRTREKRTVLVPADKSILHSDETIEWASVTASSMCHVPTD